jgi:sugar fermentation stimulation protein A
MMYNRGMMRVLPIAESGPVRAVFLARTNRVIVRAEVPGRGETEAYMPNPGRLRELLLPGATLLLSPTAAGRQPFVVAGVERDGEPVMLHTHWNNLVARRLLEARLVPGLENAEVVRAEVPVGHSRFDFLLRDPRGELLLEVKSCTLFGNGVAMFPDAVTERGRRHLEELAALSRGGKRCAVLFVVHTPRVSCFMPDYHTDLEFAQTLAAVRRDVRIIAASVRWNADLTLDGTVRALPIPWPRIGREAQDRGAYLLVLRLAEPCRIEVGGLGGVDFAAGHYVYVGSAMRGLAARMARHLRPRKRHHWHVDYLRARADRAEVLAVRSSVREECALAEAVGKVLAPGPAGFGCSDCGCATHLFHGGADHPLDGRAFHDLLERFRMRP